MMDLYDRDLLHYVQANLGDPGRDMAWRLYEGEWRKVCSMCMGNCGQCGLTGTIGNIPFNFETLVENATRGWKLQGVIR